MLDNNAQNERLHDRIEQSLFEVGLKRERDLFPLLRPINDIRLSYYFIANVSDPRVHAYGGINYQMYKLDNERIPDDTLRDELKTKQPIYTTFLADFKAPALKLINSTAIDAIGDGHFAAVLSGYFYAPLTSKL